MVMLKDAGMAVTRASDGKEAVELFKNHPQGTYDIILMDIMMPVMDGIESAKQIRALERKDAKKIPILAMTAQSAEESKESLSFRSRTYPFVASWLRAERKAR